MGGKHQAENLSMQSATFRVKWGLAVYALFVDLIQQRLQMELNLVIAQRKRRAILILGLQQILHLHVGLSDPVAYAHSVVTDLYVENPNGIGRQDDLHLVKLHGGMFVDGDEDTLIVPRLGTVDEGAELGNTTRTLEVPKMV